MNPKKPENLLEYREWIKKEFEVSVDRKLETHFDSVLQRIRINFQDSDLWRDIINNLDDFNAEYNVNTGYNLLASGISEKPIY